MTKTMAELVNALPLEWECRQEKCPCGATMAVTEWKADNGHRHRTTKCDGCMTITTIDLDLAVRITG